MNAPEKNFTGRDQKDIELLGKLMHKIVQMRIQIYVHESLKIPFEEEIVIDEIEQRRVNEHVANKCLADAEQLMYLWVGLLKFIKSEYGLPPRRKMTDLFTLHDLPLPPEMLVQAVKASNIIFLADEDIIYIFSQMVEPPRLGYVMTHLRRLLRLK